MHIREQFQTAAGNAVYKFLGRIRQMAQTNMVADAMAYAPEEITKNRDFEDIFFDDLMSRFATIMAPVKERHVIPEDIFHWAMEKRYGENTITRQEAHHELTRRMKRVRDFNEQTPVPEFLNSPVPEFLQILTDSLPSKDLAEITNQWNDIFTQIAKLTASDDALNVHMTNNNVQTASAEIVNAAIAVKNQGGKGMPALRKSNAPKLGNGFGDDAGDDSTDLDKLGEKLSQLLLPEGTLETVRKLYHQTRRMNPQSMEYSTNSKRLDVIASLPWGQFTEMNKDLNKAEQILEEDHYGLDKVKKRILNHVAVQIHTGQVNGKIICLIGPPGVGKTSIAQSVAKSLGRNYGRISLGGVSDETRIRGHASTYVGSLPGLILQGMKESKSSNPLIVLDEIDKMGQNQLHGDPTAAMLEVLDPAQNSTFRDAYAGIDFDVSKTFFFATANDESTIPGPLRDRMRIIRLPGYLPEEKLEIATRFLLPKQMKLTGLTPETFSVAREAIETLISDYTREAGVRGLEGKLSEICEEAVSQIVKGREGPIHVIQENLKDYAGNASGQKDTIPSEDQIGVVSGLYYSSNGGGILPIEVNLSPSQSGFKIIVTGNLGKVMSESAAVAESLIHVRAPQFGITDEKLNRVRLHVHAPDGAVPKDGPSAGAAFTTALVSSLTGIPIRRDVAMTGEINARGQVTAIGGLPEKLQGALAAGVTKVLIPKENIPNLEDVPQNVKDKLEIMPVDTIEDVLEHALSEPLQPLTAPDPTPRTLGTRLRDAWATLRKPTNDNMPQQAPRQAAGPRRKATDDLTP